MRLYHGRIGMKERKYCMFIWWFLFEVGKSLQYKPCNPFILEGRDNCSHELAIQNHDLRGLVRTAGTSHEANNTIDRILQGELEA